MVAVSEEEEERCGTTGRDRAMVAMVRMDMALHGVAVVYGAWRASIDTRESKTRLGSTVEGIRDQDKDDTGRDEIMDRFRSPGLSVEAARHAVRLNSKGWSCRRKDREGGEKYWLSQDGG
jgi:hypothetical protein